MEKARTYLQPVEHFFEDSPERIQRGASVEEATTLIDEVGAEKGLVTCALTTRCHGCIIGKNSNDGLDALLRIEMGNSNLGAGYQ